MVINYNSKHRKHPPTPFKGGFTISASPPLKGAGGCLELKILILNLKLKSNIYAKCNGAWSWINFVINSALYFGVKSFIFCYDKYILHNRR